MRAARRLLHPVDSARYSTHNLNLKTEIAHRGIVGTEELTPARNTRLARLAVQVILGVGLGLFFGWLAVRGVDWLEVRHALGGFASPLLIAALAVFLLGIYLRAARWRLLFLRERLGLNRLFLVQNAGIGLNSVSPLRILSEPAQFSMLTLRDRLSGSKVLATMAVDRAMDAVVNIVVVGAGIAVFTLLLPFAPFVAVGAVTSVVGISLLFMLGFGGRRVPGLRKLSLVLRFHQSLKTLGGAKGRLLLSLALSFAYWGLIGVSGWLISLSMGFEVSVLFVVVMVQAAILFSTSVPGLPGAFGTFEFATVSLLDLWGMPQEQALSYALILHLLLFLPSVVVALLVLPREGLASMGALQRALKELHPQQEPMPHALDDVAR